MQARWTMGWDASIHTPGNTLLRPKPYVNEHTHHITAPTWSAQHEDDGVGHLVLILHAIHWMIGNEV